MIETYYSDSRIAGLLAELERQIAAYRVLDCDHPLIVARDGLLYLLVDDTEFTRLLCAEYAAWALDAEQAKAGAA